jgi:Zn-dependent protease with chaperone function
MNPRRSRLPLLLPLLLAGCATATSDTGRSQFVAPRQLGAAYSEVELQAMLAFTPDARCADSACDEVKAFRARVGQIGGRLARAARELAASPTEVPVFQFIIPEKAELGTLSSAGGSIVVFDGVRELGGDDIVLAFLIAREMGHVLSKHHEENSATNLLVSAAVALAFPVANLLRGASATLSTTTALTTTSATATAATTAASMAGSRIVKSVYRPDQLREADAVALKLMHKAGWSIVEIDDALHAVAAKFRDEGWMSELQVSKARLDSMTAGPPWLMPSTLAGISQISALPVVD